MPDLFHYGWFHRQPAWHRKGDVTEEAPRSFDRVRTLGGFAWEPAEQLLYLPDADGKLAPVAGWKALVRDDTGGLLGVHRDSYGVFYHRDLEPLFDALLTDTTHVDASFILDEGRKVVVLLRLDEPTVVPGDITPSLPYIALLTAHDGSASLQAINTSVRVVCWNTWQAAVREGDRTGRLLSFRHTANIRERIAEAADILRGARHAHADYLALMGQLAGLRITDWDTTVERFLSEFIPEPPAGLVTERVMTNVDRARANFRSLLVSPTLEPLPPTGYKLVQAATEYLDHVRGFRNTDTLLGRQLLRPEPLKAKAVALVRRAAR